MVKAGDQTLVVPLSTIVETLQPKQNDVRRRGARAPLARVGGGQVVEIEQFGARRTQQRHGVEIAIGLGQVRHEHTEMRYAPGT